MFMYIQNKALEEEKRREGERERERKKERYGCVLYIYINTIGD